MEREHRIEVEYYSTRDLHPVTVQEFEDCAWYKRGFMQIKDDLSQYVNFVEKDGFVVGSTDWNTYDSPNWGYICSWPHGQHGQFHYREDELEEVPYGSPA